jgi:adenosylmethionine-8-amino-7-oxononanoate aminotransferase
MSSLGARDLAVFWHPCSQMRDYHDFPPLPVVGARGCRIELADGRVVLDGIASWWCKSLGHGHPRLRDALVRQADAFEHVITAGTTNDALVAFCERLLAAANGLPSSAWGAGAPAGRQPGHFGKVFLADNGSTGVEVALKMALQAQAQRGQPHRIRFASLANGYHGETAGALSVGDLGLYSAPFGALTVPVTKVANVPYRSGPDDPRWTSTADEWPRIEAELAPIAPKLAAIIYEPVLQAAGGMRLYSPALLPRLREWSRAHDVYLIADEIAAGMGRLGAMLASHLGDALPDFAVVSKGLTGGVLPLSAVLTTDAIYDLFDSDYVDGKAFLHSNTHTGNALAIAVALAALDVYASEGVVDRVRAGGEVLRKEMQRVVGDRPFLRSLRSAGMMAAVDLTAPNGGSLDPKARTGYRVAHEAIRRGVLLRPLGDTLYVFPPLVTPDDDLRTMVTVLAESAGAILAPR